MNGVTVLASETIMKVNPLGSTLVMVGVSIMIFSLTLIFILPKSVIPIIVAAIGVCLSIGGLLWAGINQVEDYIQFTKNKNEFVFKCNDKELLPDILIQFFNVWKNQIALLNTMQNQYLAELRDALLPDLMSGKIEL